MSGAEWGKWSNREIHAAEKPAQAEQVSKGGRGKRGGDAENAQRLDLDSYEASRERMREIEAAEAEVSAQVEQKSSPKVGRPKGGDSEVARKTGLSRGDIQRTRKHVAVADEFPALQAPGCRPLPPLPFPCAS